MEQRCLSTSLSTQGQLEAKNKASNDLQSARVQMLRLRILRRARTGSTDLAPKRGRYNRWAAAHLITLLKRNDTMPFELEDH